MGVIYFAGGTTLPSQYGNGKDGSITITSGTVNIEDIYEDDNVSGVTTNRGVDKGLNYGAGTYDPENGAYINAVDFTINSGATLTHGTAWSSGNNKNGIIWITCINKFIDNSAGNGIVMTSKGASGGAGGIGPGSPGGDGDTGNGSGGGGGGIGGTPYTKGSGGSSYGLADIPTTTWANLYGSGGGGGAGGAALVAGYATGGGGGGAGCSGTGSDGTAGEVSGGGGVTTPYNGGAGGIGGGAIRIYANEIDISSGGFVNNGSNGANGATASGAGGGGSGGSVYIEVFVKAILGTNKITCSAGIGGAGAPSEGDGGAGSTGRIHLVGSYTGSTADPAIG